VKKARDDALNNAVFAGKNAMFKALNGDERMMRDQDRLRADIICASAGIYLFVGRTFGIGLPELILMLKELDESNKPNPEREQ
jgi:hypothetical protein